VSRAAAALLAAAACFAQARDLPASVRQALARAGVPVDAVSAIVEPVAGGAAAVSYRAADARNPASVMKLVTTYAALELLGPAFTFRTDAYVTGGIAGGVLDGSLALRGGGDPKLTFDQVWLVAHDLRARGLREIRGDVILDRGYFAPASHDPARFDNEPRRAYNVGADALLVNFHAIDFRFVPTETGVRVVAVPDLPNVEIVSRVKLTQEPCGAWRRNLRYEIEERGLLATAMFDGSYAEACGEQDWPLSVFDAARFTESVWRWTWSEAGGVLRGQVRAGATPEGAKLVLRHDSEPLANLVRDMNKFSNNVMARQVFLALSAERLRVPGDEQASARLVREWLAAKRIDTAGFAIENGAGLSRDDRISAATLAALLRDAWSSPLMPEFVASLPIFGTDGTLKAREGLAAAGFAHLKGGTLTGVQSMAGYVLDRAGRRWIVVMIVNHANANAAQAALDALVEWVREGAR
jgi:D-alanyl-D-alanine carboxypeptidase/D-alanyl-D-alanine-endopeptidase (penicillin-binding protein 4)